MEITFIEITSAEPRRFCQVKESHSISSLIKNNSYEETAKDQTIKMLTM